MVEVVRYGIVGAGLMAREHIRNLAITPGAVVTATSKRVLSQSDRNRTEKRQNNLE